ncbi:putative protein VTS1 [Glarea lozoyensis 74030]|uniref:RNA-binding protein VTS1 n=1 Tax=Glarea lozoyensis (strain ATCC 74030 / MF5533) TaxID=1104152 RepID=H0ETQ0_GLAL7|nr:putative protein VTS1 [Glarea lozoyensis 74030]
MAAFQTSPSSSRIRPSSDFYGTQQGQPQGGADNDSQDKIAQQWIADIDQYENTLEEMAAATLDQDFKDELSAIEQWFRVLNPMSNRLSDAMNKLSVDGNRNSLTRPPATPGLKRHSGLDPSTINAMFPDAAAAIATEKAKFTQQTGNPPSSNRNSAAYDNRNSLAAPTIAGPAESGDNNQQPPPSPWGSRGTENVRPKSSSGQPPMGQFIQPPPSAGLRSPAAQGLAANSNLQSTTINVPDNQGSGLPPLSPYGGNGNWASMVNTPMVPSFNAPNSTTQADMVANATAMKLAALSTVNNRFALDDVRKYRRARSNDGNGPLSPGLQSNMPGAVIMVNEHGQVISRDHVMALQAQQQQQQSMGLGARRSRPNSPGLSMQGGGFSQLGFASPQNNGFLAAYDGPSPLMNNGMGSLNLAQFGLNGPEGYLSDHSEMNRGRSPRGRRGSSKPPEDPTDPSLLQDIPNMNWPELVELDDKALEERGVNALGARRKMLKVFEQVKEAKAEGKLS